MGSSQGSSYDGIAAVPILTTTKKTTSEITRARPQTTRAMMMQFFPTRFDSGSGLEYKTMPIMMPTIGIKNDRM